MRRRNSDGSAKRYPSDDIRRANKRGIDPHGTRVSLPLEVLTYEILDFPYIIGSNPPRVSPEIPDGTLWGEYSFFVPQWRKRFVPTRHLRHVTGFPKFDTPDDISSPLSDDWNTEIGWAREWIRSLGVRQGRKAWELTYARSKRPFWYVPGRIDDAVYVDIKAAYPTVYERSSWHVEYQRNKYLSIGGPILQWPFSYNWKVGRSFIVTAAQRLTPQRVIKNGKVECRTVFNRNMNRPFWSFVMDVLSSVAVYVIAAFEPLYYNCDGAIIPDKHLDSYISLCRSLGITTTIKARGSAHVTDSGFWRVGRAATKPYRVTKGETIHSSYLRVNYPPIDMTLSEAAWLMNRFSQLPKALRAR